jgi:hypothetical protein
MNKPVGVIVTGVLLIFLAFLGTTSTIIMFIGFALFRQVSAPARAIVIAETVLFVLMAIPTAFTWLVAIGLFRNKNWARIGAIVLGAFSALAGVFSGVSILLALQSRLFRAQFAHQHFALFVGEIFWLLIAIFGVWLIIYFNLESVRKSFRPVGGPAYPSVPALDAQIAQATYPQGSVPSLSPAGSGLRVSRIVVLVFAGLNLVGSLFMLVMACLGMPLVFPGLILEGHKASLALVIFAAINLVIAIGLWRRFQPAYYFALAMQLLGIVYSLSLLNPSFRARAIASSVEITARLSPQQPAQISAMMLSFQGGFIIVNGIVMSLLMAFIVWALLRDLADVRNAPTAQGHN